MEVRCAETRQRLLGHFRFSPPMLRMLTGSCSIRCAGVMGVPHHADVPHSHDRLQARWGGAWWECIIIANDGEGTVRLRSLPVRRLSCANFAVYHALCQRFMLSLAPLQSVVQDVTVRVSRTVSTLHTTCLLTHLIHPTID